METSRQELQKLSDDFFKQLETQAEKYGDYKYSYIAGYLSSMVKFMIIDSDNQSAASYVRSIHNNTVWPYGDKNGN